MTIAATHGNQALTARSAVEAAQNAELAALIRRIATQRPEILTAWTPPPPPRPAAPPPPRPVAPTPRPATPQAPVQTPAPVPVSRRPHPLPMPRPLPALAPHPVTGDWPTREDFPVDRATVAFLARLRAIAAGTHKPHAHGPAHATDAYLAKKRRPARWRRIAHAIAHSAGPVNPLASVLAATALPLAAVLLLTVSCLPG